MSRKWSGTRSPLVAAVLLFCLGPPAPAEAAAPGATAAVPSYYVQVDPDSFAFIIQYPHANHYISATVTIDGRVIEGVRMRIRGDSSRNLPKKSFKLEFAGPPLPDGTRTLNLNADYLDASYLHTALASRLIARSGQPVFDARHAALYVNDSFYGLYLQVENVDEAFLARVGLDPQGNLYKAALDGSCLSLFDDVDYHWEKETNEGEGRSDLRELIQAINTVPQSDYEAFARDWFDYDQMVNVLAMNMLISNGSTYYHNYFMYHDVRGSGKWMYLNWDMDFSFRSYGSNYDYRRSSGSGTPDNPFPERAIISQEILSDIRERIEAATADFFNPSFAHPIIDSIAAAIEPFVALDTLDNVADVAYWREQVEAEKRFFDQRPPALLNQIDTWPRSFRLNREQRVSPDGITFSWSKSHSPTGEPVTYAFVLGRSTTYSPTSDRVIRGITDTTFTLTPMPEPGRYFWQVTAVEENGSYADGYDSWNPIVVGDAGAPPIVINEINYNGGTATAAEDWVEFYNPLADTIGLAGWRFDDGPNRFTFPENARIEPFGYLVLARSVSAFSAWYADGPEPIGDLGFGLSSDGETLRLVSPLLEVVDSVTYSPAAPWPTDANGHGYTLSLRNPSWDNARAESWTASRFHGGTPGAANGNMSTSADELVDPGVAVMEQNYPNPFSHSTRIGFRLVRPGDVRVEATDVMGRTAELLANGWFAAGHHEITWHPRLPSGTYFLRLMVNGEVVGRVGATIIR